MTSPLHLPVGAHGTDHLGAGVEEPIARICCYCTPAHVMSEGSRPASHGMCEIATAREMARLDALEAEAGGIGVDPVSQVALGIAAGLQAVLGGDGPLGKRQGELG